MRLRPASADDSATYAVIRCHARGSRANATCRAPIPLRRDRSRMADRAAGIPRGCRCRVFGAAGVVCFFAAASAHVTLEKSQAPIGAPYKAVLRVPHGCEGSATTALRIRVPDGMIAVKPMPKPGWKVETVIGKYQKSYDYF